MAKPLLDDDLRELIQPLLPLPKPRRFLYPGRKPVPTRAALTGILFVLKTGIPWEHLPQEMGCGSGMTCWRRLRDGHAAGVWEKIHRVLLDRLRGADKIDFSRAVVDSGTVRAVGGRGNRPKPCRSQEKRLEARHHHGRQRPPVGHAADRRKPARCDAVVAVGGGDPADSRQARSAASAPSTALRGPGVRFLGASRDAVVLANRTADRGAEHRA